MRTSRVSLLAITVVLFSPVFANAQLSAARPDPMSVITFIGEINTQSMGQLLAVVNNQVRIGVKKIRIVISSGGGDPSAGFSAYSYLHGLQGVDISTFNVGNVDSAAILVYCAGQQRYAVPGARFVMHGNSLTMGGPSSMDVATLQGNLEILKNLNAMETQVIDSTVNKDKKADVDSAVHGQTILTSEDAQKWGLVNEIRSNFMEPGATLVTVNVPASPTPEIKPPIQFTSETQEHFGEELEAR